MKILIINDLYDCGGAEYMARLQKKILEKKGHNVKFITLDTDTCDHGSKEDNHFSIGRKYNKLESLLYRYILDYKIYRNLKKIILDFNPDIIHLHNIYVSSRAVFKALEGYRCVQTIHDYSISCVKSTSIYNDGSLCQGVCFNKCFKRCFRGTFKDKLIFLGRYFALKLNNRLRKKYVSKFISPSKFLGNISKLNDFDTVTINNPIEFKPCDKDITHFKNNKKQYLYFGAVNRVKGVKQLVDAFKVFSCDKEDVELLIAGSIKKDFEEEFFELISSCNNIKYLGKLPHDKVRELLMNVYVVVIPSLWIENYPGTLLEAIACRCLVIASNRGGMPEMLSYNTKLLFNVLDNDDIVNKMNYVYGITKTIYNNHVEDIFIYNSFITINDCYLKKIEVLYNLLGEQK